MRFSLRAAVVAASIAATSLVAGCNSGVEQADAQEQQAPPPPAVGVVTLEPENIPFINELPGRIAPTRIANVLPRASGIIDERVFTQGSLVEKGDVLYRIDPVPFQVQLRSAEASLERARSVARQAEQEAQRQAELRQRNVVSEEAAESAEAVLAQARADVAIAEASVAEAQLQLDYSEVKAPISGRIGRANITEGALVSANSGETLATIQQLDPVYADFTQTATELLALRETLVVDGGTAGDPGEAPIMLEYDDGTAYEHEGRLLFLETTVDPSTGQVTLRGEFPNPDGDLLPGMYVRVRIQQGVDEAALAVPKQAVQRDANGNASAFVVGEDNVVGVRQIQLGRSIDTRWIVTEGLEPGDRVVAEGVQKIAPDATVVPEPWNSGTEAEAPAKEDGATTSDDAPAAADETGSEGSGGTAAAAERSTARNETPEQEAR